jgi:hypothetical protein
VKTKIIITSIILIGIAIFAPPSGLAQDFPDVCQQPENILRNCNFNSGLEHWHSFLETGSAEFSVLQGGGECHAPLCPAAYIVTGDHFIGGLYQQVQVTPGRNYYANIVWLVFDSLVNDGAAHQAAGGIGRRIGLDPFGGSDPTSPTIVWSPDNWRNDCKICNIEQVTVTAQADTITLFLRLDDTWKVRAAEKGFPTPPSKDQFWIDDIGLKEVGGEPIIAEAAPTDTPAPPPVTDTPVPQAPTNTPAPPTATPTPATPAAEIAQVETPIAEPITPTAPNTPVPPPPTLTPTYTRMPTRTPLPKPAASPASIQRAVPIMTEPSQLPAIMGVAGAVVLIGGFVLVVMALVLAGLLWLYKVGWRHTSPEFDDEVFDNDDQ